MEEQTQSIALPCIKIDQPVGTFYIASISSKVLCEITDFDVRRMVKDRDIETYLGIQRPVSDKRVKEIGEYVNTKDACFPTAVILAIDGNCATFDANSNALILTNYLEPEKFEDKIHYRQIARVLDGQHRIEGLKNYNQGGPFEVNVSIFIDIDIEDQAYIFSTVNLAQTKVNKSLVYDLFDLSKSRSPQKTCHNIAVALDKHQNSPFSGKIKRLGVATEGRFNETITQATFVKALMPYISSSPLKDRDLFLRGKQPELGKHDEILQMIFRPSFIQEKDLDIADNVWNYFDAVKTRWPDAWANTGQGFMLNKTNGFNGLMRFLRPAYLYFASPGQTVKTEQYLEIFKKIEIEDEYFNVSNYPPGSSGSSTLYKDLMRVSGLDKL